MDWESVWALGQSWELSVAKKVNDLVNACTHDYHTIYCMKEHTTLAWALGRAQQAYTSLCKHCVSIQVKQNVCNETCLLYLYQLAMDFGVVCGSHTHHKATWQAKSRELMIHTAATQQVVLTSAAWCQIFKFDSISICSFKFDFRSNWFSANIPRIPQKIPQNWQKQQF